MSTRLATGGRLIDRSQPLKFRFNDRRMQGYKGDTLASALLGVGQTLMGRSFKYHRPRGAVASGAEEPNALVNLGRGSRVEPNQRTTVTELFNGLEAHSQNHWPSLDFDIGVANSAIARFLPPGSTTRPSSSRGHSGSMSSSRSFGNPQALARRRKTETRIATSTSTLLSMFSSSAAAWPVCKRPGLRLPAATGFC